jgi:hypothetical protein
MAELGGKAHQKIRLVSTFNGFGSNYETVEERLADQTSQPGRSTWVAEWLADRRLRAPAPFLAQETTSIVVPSEMPSI